MFNRSGRTEATSNHPPVGNSKRGTGFSVLGPDVVMTGNVRATADLHIEGQIDGDVDCGTLVLGPEARIKGDVRADIARIAGMIEGSVTVRQITVEAGARITGDVEYDTISLATGSKIDGRLKHCSSETHKPQPALGGPKELKMVDAPSDVAA